MGLVAGVLLGGAGPRGGSRASHIPLSGKTRSGSLGRSLLGDHSAKERGFPWTGSGKAQLGEQLVCLGGKRERVGGGDVAIEARGGGVRTHR